MNDAVIEKGVPVPVAKASNAGLSGTLKKLEVGDSFVWSIVAKSNVHYYAMRVGIKVTTRKVSETEIRIWRVA